MTSEGCLSNRARGTISRMRFSSLFSAGLATAVFGAAIVASHAYAAEEVDIAVKDSKVTVTAKGSWHINKSYPWKLEVGETKLDVSKFTLSEKSASVAAPKGSGKLRGGVCNGDQCRMITEPVTIP